MQQIASKFRNALWYLRRPRLYPEFFEVARFQLMRPLHARAEREAQRWCEARAVDTHTALAALAGQPDPAPVRRLFERVFAEADRVGRAAEAELNRVPPFVPAGAANLDLLYWLAERVGARNVIETGVAYGWSSLAFLLSLSRRAPALLISTDLPFPGKDDAYVGCVVPAELRINWRLIRRPDREALPLALRELPAIDMCHYDSDKSYRGRMWAYPRLWRALRPGGCFVSDDIGDNFAFRDFFASVRAEYTVVRTVGKKKTKYVGVAVKPARASAV